MTTRSVSDREDFLAARQALQPVRGQSRLGGFRNLFAKELGEWFGTRRWLWQALIWLVIISGMLGFVLFAAPAIDPSGAPDDMLTVGMSLYFSMAVIAGTIGAVILAQDEVIREKQSGTAAWILSKPVSRASFILTKVLANIIGVAVFIVALPGVVSYVEIALATGSQPAWLPFLAGMGVILLGLVFYISLTILLGTLFEQRGPLLGISFGLMFGGLILVNFAPQLNYVLPLALDKISLVVAMGQPLDAMMISQLISTAILSILFTLIAVWRFRNEEF